MAKTIKEIAESILERDKDKIVCVYDRYAGIIDGANAVLQEIEKAMDLGEPPHLISVEQAYYIVSKLIKQLKGE